MKVQEGNDECIQSFTAWWKQRIEGAKERKQSAMPNFYEVWAARQPEIDALKREIENLKRRIK